MILYVNGDSHSAGAEAVTSYCFAEDDTTYLSLGRAPHPDNLRASYGQRIANSLGYELVCQAESASSNDRIVRTTKEYLKDNKPDLIIIGWSNWEREEWHYNNIYWQINGMTWHHDWPKELLDRHKEWVLNLNHNQKLREWHYKIWEFHQELAGIPHLFFNCFSGFDTRKVIQKDWNKQYLNAYDTLFSYQHWVKSNGFKTSTPTGHHFGADAHQAWADFLIPQLTKIIKESIITK